MHLTDCDEQDAQDMAQLAEGDDSALNRLMERHASRLFHYLIRALDDEGDAADLAQETFVRVYQSRAKFDRSRKFTTWLYAIGSNLVRDRYRWRSRHPQVSLDADDETPGAGLKSALAAPDSLPDGVLQASQRASLVQEAVAALPTELREPLILAVYEELPQAEIAAMLGCSVKGVETRIYRARQQLRAALRGLLPSL
jgi:RNA polymerase sigma-70 factor (ECF subfamily)